MMAYYPQHSSPSPPRRHHHMSQPSSPTQPATFDDADDFLSSDLDISFASTMSITSAPSSPTGNHDMFLEPMDISPAKPSPCYHESYSNTGSYFSQNAPQQQQPRRPFGTEVGNISAAIPPSSPSPFGLKPVTRPRSNTVLPPIPRPMFGSQSQKAPGNGRARAALPTTWLQQEALPVKTSMRAKRSGTVFSTAVVPPSPVPSMASDAMDIDMPSPAPVRFSAPKFMPPPSSPEPLPTLQPSLMPKDEDDFSALFFHPSSPENSPAPAERPSSFGNGSKKRRSPEPAEDEQRDFVDRPAPHVPHRQLMDGTFSSSPPSSPSHNKHTLPRTFDRAVTTGGHGTLFGPSRQMGGPSQPQAALPKRGVPRRPTLSAVMTGLPRQSSASAATTMAEAPIAPPPTRRAFSACISARPTMMSFDDEDEPSDYEIDHSSPAQRAHAARKENIGRLGNRQIPHMRPFGSPLAAGSAKKVAGLSGFGDNESDGKILPCHKVREDGLMRINCDTLQSLMEGVYDDEIKEFHIIDCRFDYEHNGGHIPGAVNLNTNDAIEEYLLGENKPQPGRSGDGIGKKTVIVFHCEFSVKRAPTFAKHMRSKDRSLNHHVYPKVHYPEVYILEGGYSQYYKERSECCLPSAYVRMDDPAHLRSRAEDLNDFRRWNRTRSFTYGEQRTGQAPAASQPARPLSTDHAGSKGGLSFAAANAAVGRRNGNIRSSVTATMSLSTLQEDADSSCASEADLGDSPCPPSFRPAPMGMARPKMMGRALTAAVGGSRR